MMTFVPSFVSNSRREWVEAGEQGTAPEVTVAEVADHCDYVRERIGIYHIGLGGDYDGTAFVPDGLESVAGYPRLIAELLDRGWSEADLAKLTWHNAVRVLRDAEAVARSLAASTSGRTSTAAAPRARTCSSAWRR